MKSERRTLLAGPIWQAGDVPPEALLVIRGTVSIVAPSGETIVVLDPELLKLKGVLVCAMETLHNSALEYAVIAIQPIEYICIPQQDLIRSFQNPESKKALVGNALAWLENCQQNLPAMYSWFRGERERLSSEGDFSERKLTLNGIPRVHADDLPDSVPTEITVKIGGR